MGRDRDGHPIRRSRLARAKGTLDTFTINATGVPAVSLCAPKPTVA